jgi:hypothetical protein
MLIIRDRGLRTFMVSECWGVRDEIGQASPLLVPETGSTRHYISCWYDEAVFGASCLPVEKETVGTNFNSGYKRRESSTDPMKVK